MSFDGIGFGRQTVSAAWRVSRSSRSFSTT